MVRIRVIHASRLLLTLALILLAAALILLLAQSVSRASASPPAVTVLSGSLTASGQNAFASERVSSALSFLMPPKIEISRSAPVPDSDEKRSRILIYHTHTREAYAPTEADSYPETDAFRTDDASHSVVRVGEELAALLRDRGFEVIHDTTDHDYAPMDAAYDRSLTTLLGYAGEDFAAVIDLHRDAWSDGLTDCAVINGSRIAPLLLLVGEGTDTDYEANLTLACRVTDALRAVSSDLCRPVLVKSGCYNQNVFTPSLLIEVGHTHNTLREALNALPYLADALEQSLPQTQKSGEQPSPDP